MKYRFITSTRGDLVELTSIFARAIKPQILTRDEPILINTNGSFESGKKIIPDVMRDEILDHTLEIRVDGHDEYDEYALGYVYDEEVEISFINVAWESDYSDDDLNESLWGSGLVEVFLEKRVIPGITFINNNYQGDCYYDIEVFLESKDKEIVYFDDVSRLEKDEQLAAIFNNKSGSWDRYFEVQINDESVLDKTALDILSPALEQEDKEPEVKPLIKGIYAYA